MGRGVGGGSKGIGVMGKMGNDGTSFSTVPVDYQLLEEIGQGGSATVYRAIYLPLNEVVAIKCVDLDRCNSNLDDIRREAQTMSLIEHANVVTAYCTFVVDRCLWVVMPFMAVGSCFHIMKTAYPDGFEEPVIGSILKETLKALEYLHRHGHIHRDIKAANILLDSNGFVKLGDFGVSACMFDKGDRQHSRNTFVGTPCWMAPEVLQKDSGYNFKADIWSFGITALELAHGHAPFSKYPPMKVLLMTIQNAPPGLDYERDKKFSKSFKEMVAMCLVKDQTKRPTAEKLLKHSFFKNAKPPEMSLKNLLLDFPPLWDLMKALQLKDAEQLALKRMPSSEQEAVSQNEYNRGVSAWNFDIQDLKAQASLIQDDELQLVMSEEDERLRSLHDKHSSFSRPPLSFIADSNEAYRGSSSSTSLESKCLNKKKQNIMSESTCSSNGPHCVSQCAALKDDMERISGVENKGKNSFRYQNPKSYENEILLPSKVVHLDQDSRPERSEGNNLSMPEKILKRDDRKESSVSVPLMLPRRASMNNLSAPIRTSAGYRDTHEDKSKSNVVQIKGRFSVTSENVDAVKDVPLGTISRRSTQGSPLRKSASVGNWHAHTKPMPVTFKEIGELPVSPSVLLTHLQNLLQQTESQQDLLMGLIDSLQQNELANGRLHLQVPTPDSGALNEALPSEGEKLLLTNISALQNRVSKLTDELAAEKAKHLHLQEQLDGTPDRVKAGTRQGEKSES